MPPDRPRKARQSLAVKAGNPPRPRNPFIIYRNQVQAEVTSRYQNASGAPPGKKPTMAVISKVIAAQWQNESAEVRAHFTALAQEEKRLHNENHPEYKYRPAKLEEKLEARLKEREAKASIARERELSKQPRRTVSGSSSKSAAVSTPGASLPSYDRDFSSSTAPAFINHAFPSQPQFYTTNYQSPAHEALPTPRASPQSRIASTSAVTLDSSSPFNQSYPSPPVHRTPSLNVPQPTPPRSDLAPFAHDPWPTGPSQFASLYPGWGNEVAEPAPETSEHDNQPIFNPYLNDFGLHDRGAFTNYEQPLGPAVLEGSGVVGQFRLRGLDTTNFTGSESLLVEGNELDIEQLIRHIFPNPVDAVQETAPELSGSREIVEGVEAFNWENVVEWTDALPQFNFSNDEEGQSAAGPIAQPIFDNPLNPGFDPVNAYLRQPSDSSDDWVPHAQYQIPSVEPGPYIPPPAASGSSNRRVAAHWGRLPTPTFHRVASS
ncbi:hypothetical protein SISSUDRAFT_1116346 [Sistotremastrum suecicum HHB10207 ss-3]|uniref:HMG box domain-containing protein n=1 Tax=Sistotremastrum suecicum HHB10207 ss-3 TaxID=1314776 RepID=A0A166IES7_9AGAM|nr:hypothetical protein SISSUDRAFT_1116346 [Sistotremastrum suecicum HHB10207 ss-3]